MLIHSSIYRTIYKMMNKVYFRNAEGSNDLHISFRYKNSIYNIDRDFNFRRSLGENVDNALKRVKSNLVKEINKKSKSELKKSKKENGKQSEKELDISVEFSRNDKVLTNISFNQLINQYLDGLSLKIMHEHFEVLMNQPFVVNLSLPSIHLAGFMVYPSKIELQFADIKYCRAEWFRGKKPSSGNGEEQVTHWTKCGEEFFYYSTVDDIGHLLKLLLTPGNANNIYGVTVEKISKNEVEAGPGLCPFENRHLFTQHRLNGEALRLVSYNILADLYADSDFTRNHLFPYCQPFALHYEYRKQLIIKELLGYNADIICLQEVDMKAFNSDLQIVLETSPQKFIGFFSEKGSSGEGLATFFREDRFDLIHNRSFNLGKSTSNLPHFKVLWEKINKNANLVKRLTERSTTLQITILKSKDVEKYLLIANTHLYFHPNADHIRLLQVGLAIMFIEDTIEEFKLPQISLIFCGDFNSTPECGIYKLMTGKSISDNLEDWKSCKEEIVEGITLSHPINMKSAYENPKYTNYTHTFAACLDYIFYQSDFLEIQQTIPLPLEEELTSHVAIPSVIFPSDHLALIADFKFKK